MKKNTRTWILQLLKYTSLAVATSLILHSVIRAAIMCSGFVFGLFLGENLGLLIGMMGAQIVLLLFMWYFTIKPVRIWICSIPIQLIVYYIDWIIGKALTANANLEIFYIKSFDIATPVYLARMIGDILIIQLIAVLMHYPKVWLISFPLQVIALSVLWYYQINFRVEHFVAVLGSFWFAQIAIMGLKWIYSLVIQKKKSKITAVGNQPDNPI